MNAISLAINGRSWTILPCQDVSRHGCVQLHTETGSFVSFFHSAASAISCLVQSETLAAERMEADRLEDLAGDCGQDGHHYNIYGACALCGARS